MRVAAIAAAALLAAVPASALPTRRSTPPRVLLTYAVGARGVSGAGNGSGICIARSDGTHRIRLTRPGDDTQPAWSADGSRLAFTRQNPGSDDVADILVMRSDGTGVRNLTRAPPHVSVANFQPAWAPDGRRIAYATGWHETKIAVMATDGRSRRSLGGDSSESQWAPTWSPDGRRIAYVAGNARVSAIDVVSVDGTGNRVLVNDGDQPAWSPDATTIAFVRDGDIFVVDAGGGAERRLTATPEREDGPAWSPRGRFLAYRRQGSSWGAIVVRAVASGSERVILRGTREQPLEPAWRAAASRPRGMGRC